jgi:gliding motility-associated-like protein
MYVLKKITFILILIYYVGTKLYAQSAYNLVPNYSFEKYNSPPLLGVIPYDLKDWYYGAGTPDNFSIYLNSISPSQGVPSNVFGYQYAHTGNSYVGMGTIAADFSGNLLNWREYVQSKLKDSLLKDHCYQVIFYVSLADSNTLYCNDIGAYFSKDSFSYSNYNVLPFFPQISNNITTNPLNSCTGWTKVEGTFIAQGGESHITIGNFKNDNNSVFGNSICSGFRAGAYHYLDDVWVIPCDTTAIIPIPENELSIPNVFTPNGDGINDVFAFKINGTLTDFSVYNRWGNGIKNSTLNTNTYISWDGHATSGEECSSGVYFYTLVYKDSKGDTIKKNGYVMLIR